MKNIRTFTPVRATRKPSSRRAAPVARPTSNRQIPPHFTFTGGGGAGARTAGLSTLVGVVGGRPVGMNTATANALAFALGTPSTGAQLTRGAAPITRRQVEVMTATLCDVIANKRLAPEQGVDSIGQLIRAMVTQVSRLNVATTKDLDDVIPRASPRVPD